MKTLKNLWRYSKLTAILLVTTTIGWVMLVGLMWWALIFIGASLGWMLIMAGTTALLTFLFWIIWGGFAKVVN